MVPIFSPNNPDDLLVSSSKDEDLTNSLDQAIRSKTI